MVLRSGIILPFQFRDTKKLLMIGVPEENRDLSIWDLKNVVRAAFGIYNFEFRNKKIGFNIPDELLLQYLAQRHDLTNFVIEIGQGNDEAVNMLKDQLSYEPSCSQKQICVALPQKSNESSSNMDSPLPNSQIPQQLYGMNVPNSMSNIMSRSRSPIDTMENQSDHSNNLVDTEHKIRISQVYNTNNSESITQAIGPMVIPKSEQDDSDMVDTRDLRYERQEQVMQQQQHQLQHQHQHEQQQQHHHQQQLHQQQQQQLAQHFVGNYATHHSMLANQNSSVLCNPSSPLGAVPTPSQSNSQVVANVQQHNAPTSQQSQYSPVMMSRFRIFDPCKDNYHALISNCFSCRCGSTQKQALDLHEPSKPDTASGQEQHQHHHNQQQQQHFSSASNSQHSPNNEEEPPLKLRITNLNTLPSNMDTEQFEIEPKIDYDDASSPPSAHTQQQNLPQHHHQPQQPATGEGSSHAISQQATAVEALALSSSTSALKLHNNPDTDEDTSYMERELQEQELHLERMHEYFMQQQQQHLQQQQQQHQQHQPHIDSLLQESTSSHSLRQRKERMSKKQKEVYVNFLEQHAIINEHRRNDPALNRYWIKLADILNSVPQGAVKHVAEWKQTFDNWRYRVFLYARYNSKISGEEALNPKCFKPLTLTDKRAYNIWIRNPDTAPPDLEQMRNVFMNLEEAQPE